MRGFGDGVQHVADAHRIGIGQVEGPAIEPVEMGEVVDRGDDEIDGHDIDPATLDADHRNPGRYGVAQLLDELEEVVGAVDLVDLAGSRVADDDAWTINPPGDRLLRPHQALALVLRGVIRMLESARLLEHVLAKYAVVQPGRRDRAHVMEATRLDRLGEGEGVGDAGHIGGHDLLRRSFEVVDRGEMEEMVDFALELARVLGRNAEIGLGDIALDHRHAFGAGAPELFQSCDQLRRRLIDKDVNRLTVALEQPPDKPPADEPRSPRYERTHEPYLPFSRLLS